MRHDAREMVKVDIGVFRVGCLGNTANVGHRDLLGQKLLAAVKLALNNTKHKQTTASDLRTIFSVDQVSTNILASSRARVVGSFPNLMFSSFQSRKH